MKKIVITALATLLFCSSQIMAQTPSGATPDGLVIILSEHFNQSRSGGTKGTFIAGPYAQYAQNILAQPQERKLSHL